MSQSTLPVFFVLFFVLSSCCFSETASVSADEVYADFRRVVELRKNIIHTEEDIQYDLSCLDNRNNYEAIVVHIADLYIAGVMHGVRLELVWWRARNPKIRMLVLLLYYKKYGNKGVSGRANFIKYSEEFSEVNRYMRLEEIDKVLRFLKLR